MSERPRGIDIRIARCECDGVAICVDVTEVYDGSEQTISRMRFACEDPTEALDVVASALWPTREFTIKEETDDAATPHRTN